ncbi:hypothetical protein [Paractinoplanes atraurantiacus]|uniref:Uncharacterized protein n=1 Tax=Paractinoplanes atraurantiacus TaxID=1036182 RepID=A0A285FA55_9ACTN|nr:hypothetical protein [Actinoplanes atraurantiacus]SNY08162.1 hypothetical protein SAMN05421748_101832 [Actinoplanes atraurantiacus]
MAKFGSDDLGPWSEFGTVAGMVATQNGQDLSASTEVHTGLGDNPDLDNLPAVTGFGDAPLVPDSPLVLDDAIGEAVRETAEAVRELEPPDGYDNQVDADGDGTLDEATYRGRADGGVDILVDLNDDGRTDFIGVDLDLDNRVDFAGYDKDHDGDFEKRMYDDDGDGFLDRAVWTEGS